MLNNTTYNNSLLNKSKIFKDNLYKIGVYRWINKITNESYVGSSKNITKRLRRYFSINYLNDRTCVYNSRIYIALLKYGHENFDLEILEYCEEKFLIEKEQFYIDLYKPEYNICKIAGSLLGFRHSPETLLKFKNRTSVTSHTTNIINIYDNSVIKYSSVRSAAKDIGISHTTMLRYINNNKIIKNTYKIDRCKPIL